MDNLTHTLAGAALAGAALAGAGLARRCGPGATFTLLLASNVADVDSLLALVLDDGAPLARQTVRRGFTHSVLGLPVVAAAVATAVRPLFPARRWRTLFGLALLAATVHVLLDLVNSYGVVLLHPFRDRRYELASVFIVDLAVWAILLAPFLLLGLRRLGLPLRSGAEALWRSSLAALALYGGLCLAARARAEAILDGRIGADGPAEFAYVFPEPFGPHRWRGVVRRGGVYRTYLLRVLEGTAEEGPTFRTDAGDPRVEAVRSTEAARRVEWFFKAPVWRLRPDGGVEAFDLRFRSLVLRRRNPFAVRFPPAEPAGDPSPTAAGDE